MAERSQMERALEGLMPRGMGNETQIRLARLIDDLAKKEAAESPPASRRKPVYLAAAASAILGMCLAAFLKSPAEMPTASLLSPVQPEFEILEKGWWIEDGRDGGIQPASDDGAALRSWSFSGVEEERLRHKPTGYTVILQREVEGEHYLPTSL